jgi:transient receptor potential cation channel subfamily V protein 5
MKRSLAIRNFEMIDDAMSIRLKPYLYNGGRGRKVSFAEMVLLRNRERSQQKQVFGKLHFLFSMIVFK